MPFSTGGFGPSLVWALTSLVADSIFYTIFGAIGAMIAVSLFWKKPQATPTATN